MEYLKGIGASPGIAMGNIYIKKEIETEIKEHKIIDVELELRSINNSIEKSKEQLKKIYEYSRINIGEEEAEVFKAHISMLNDEEFWGQVKFKIQNERKNALWAIKESTDYFINIFEQMDNEYIKERIADIKEVSLRVMKALLNIEDNELRHLKEKTVIIAKNLTTSDTAQIDKDKVLGFITECGGKTSHTAIIARTMEIPAVVGVKGITARVSDGDYIIIDGNEGNIIVNPQNEILNKYFIQKEKNMNYKIKLNKLINDKSITLDKLKVKIEGNIGSIEEAKTVRNKGGEGIGLFRTEFLFMDRNTLPSEEEQYKVYKNVAQIMQKEPVVIRTLDIGGDKEIPYLNIEKEDNPFLGMRAIRLCLKEVDIWRTQLRAILRASVYGNIKIMIPMISTIDELKKSKEIIEQVKGELESENIRFNKDIQIGIMIETPAAAIMSDIFAREVDFFSIGTNDLIQYTMAADRINPNVAELYSLYSPSVLRLIKLVIDNAHKEKIKVAVCGEAAADDKLIPLLIGMGLDQFSMNSGSILEARYIIKNTSHKRMKEKLQYVLQLKTSNEVEKFLKKCCVRNDI